jgi:hypothetical protein
MENIYRFFQVHNVSNRTYYIRSLDNNVPPYADITDERFHWLDLTFRNYINDVQQSSTSAGIQGLSRETANALNLLQKNTCLCVKFLLS